MFIYLIEANKGAQHASQMSLSSIRQDIYSVCSYLKASNKNQLFLDTVNDY